MDAATKRDWAAIKPEFVRLQQAADSLGIGEDHPYWGTEVGLAHREALGFGAAPVATAKKKKKVKGAKKKTPRSQTSLASLA